MFYILVNLDYHFELNNLNSSNSSTSLHRGRFFSYLAKSFCINVLISFDISRFFGNLSSFVATLFARSAKFFPFHG